MIVNNTNKPVNILPLAKAIINEVKYQVRCASIQNLLETGAGKARVGANGPRDEPIAIANQFVRVFKEQYDLNDRKPVDTIELKLDDGARVIFNSPALSSNNTSTIHTVSFSLNDGEIDRTQSLQHKTLNALYDFILKDRCAHPASYDHVQNDPPLGETDTTKHQLAQERVSATPVDDFPHEGFPRMESGQQLNRSSQATMEKTLKGVCIPAHRVAPSSLTGLNAGVSNPSQIFDKQVNWNTLSEYVGFKKSHPNLKADAPFNAIKDDDL